MNKTSCLDHIVRRRNVVNGSEDVFLRILVPICSLIKKQFPLFFAKIYKIAYTCNSKDAKHSNRNNFIFVQDIDTIFACIIGFSGSANSNTLKFLKFQGAKGVTMATKFGQKKPKLQTSLLRKKSRTFFAPIVRFSGSANSNMLSKISREPRELPWQPNLGKNKPKLH